MQSENRPTIKKLLQTALLPVGKTMYVWGGGWNETDDGPGLETRSLGLFPRWEAFAAKQDSGYDYRKTRYQIHDGLDCSGYMGWVLYNTLETQNGREGYVMPAKRMAQEFAEKGWGSFTPKEKVTGYRAGDLMSGRNHVYLVLGACRDQSMVLLHSSPPGVQLCAARKGYPNGAEDQELPSADTSEAAELVRAYRESRYPIWQKRYPEFTRGEEYLREYHQMRWFLDSRGILRDPEGYRRMWAEEILEDIFD